MKHLELKDILSYIHNKVDGASVKNIEDHLLDCDKCFLEYSIYKTSYEEIESNNLIQPSSDTISTIEKKLSTLKTEKKKSLIENIFNKIDDLISAPQLGPVFATCIVLFVVLFVSPQNFDHKDITRGNEEQILDGFIKIPDLRGFDIISIIDTLEALELDYEIKYYSREFKQTPSLEREIMLKSEKIYIEHPSPNPE